MGKRPTKKRQDSDEEMGDEMAWGKNKQNYYQEEEDEYSSGSEELQEAELLHEKQYEILNNPDIYELPDENNEAESDAQEDESVDGINEEYVKNEILWTTELAKMFEGVQDEKSIFRKQVYDNYLLILMCLKQFRIPHIDQHPLVQSLPDLKKALTHFEQELPTLYENMYGKGSENRQTEEYDDDEEENEESEREVDMNESENEFDMEEENFDEEFQQFQNEKPKKRNKKIADPEGLEIYNQKKFEKEQERKQKKAEGQRKQQERPKPGFKIAKENEGRLASQMIMKNKGMMKRRAKGDGNSRVKLRLKHKKAEKVRKSKGLGINRENPGIYYEGEKKVNVGKIASTKIK